MLSSLFGPTNYLGTFYKLKIGPFKGRKSINTSGDQTLGALAQMKAFDVIE